MNSVLNQIVLPFSAIAGLLLVGWVAIVRLKRILFSSRDKPDAVSFIEMRNSGRITKEEWDKIKSRLS